MKIKVLKHRVRDNLFIFSSDLYAKVSKKGYTLPDRFNVLDNTTEILEDKYLNHQTVMVPDRVYFDKKLDKTLADMKWFAEVYFKN